MFVTSGAATNTRAYRGPYSVTKAALNALARTYAAETVTTNVRVNLINPGPTRTRMRAAAMPGEDPMSVKPVETVAEQIVAMCLPDFQETGKLYDCEKGRCWRCSRRREACSACSPDERKRDPRTSYRDRGS